MITSFRGEHRFLSNFWPSPITYKGERFASVEHAYQASKAILPTQHELIRVASTPGVAKHLGRHATIRLDWDDIKENVMRECVSLKFQIPELKDLLLRTGSQELIEGNTWNDQYWGAVNVNGKWIGQNKLGKILMDIRERLK